MKAILTVLPSEDEVQNWISRYHFEENDLFDFLQRKREVEAVVEAKVYFEWEENDRIAAILTLGIGVDHLIENYTRLEQLREAYMIECIAMEYLQSSYQEFNKVIKQIYQKEIGNYQFLGESCPLEEIANVFQIISQSEVVYNEAYMMTPLKSVCFYTEITEKNEERTFNICKNCNNKKCSSRNKSS